jgi:hypothetical protein
VKGFWWFCFLLVLRFWGSGNFLGGVSCLACVCCFAIALAEKEFAFYRSKVLLL